MGAEAEQVTSQQQKNQQLIEKVTQMVKQAKVELTVEELFH